MKAVVFDASEASQPGREHEAEEKLASFCIGVAESVKINS